MNCKIKSGRESELIMKLSKMTKILLSFCKRELIKIEKK